MRVFFSNRSPHGAARAFTFIEIVATVAILAVLISLTFVAYKRFLHSGDEAICISNMRTLYGALAAYTSDYGHWPQQPDFDMKNPETRKAYSQWWIDTLKPYTDSTKIWKCPTLNRLELAQGVTETSIHYTPTVFDAFPNRPYQWPNMPWLVEIGASHRDGSHLLFPDGSVRNFQSMLDAWK